MSATKTPIEEMKAAATAQEAAKERCPNCGYCPHCGQSRTTPWYPAPYYVPMPYYPRWVYPSTYTYEIFCGDSTSLSATNTNTTNVLDGVFIPNRSPR